MRIQRVRQAVLHVTLSAYEMAALVAAARWVPEGAEGELPPEALDQLWKVVAGYAAACANAEAPGAAAR